MSYWDSVAGANHRFTPSPHSRAGGRRAAHLARLYAAFRYLKQRKNQSG
jgi:hypothetical protein